MDMRMWHCAKGTEGRGTTKTWVEEWEMNVKNSAHRKKILNYTEENKMKKAWKVQPKQTKNSYYFFQALIGKALH